MIPKLLGRHRTLLFRSYLFLVAGLLSVAAVLDFGFGYLQSSLEPQDDPALNAGLVLIETRLADLARDEQDAAAARLSQDLGLDVRLLERDDIAAGATPVGAVETLVDADGNRSYLYDAPSLDRLVLLGPVDTRHESRVLALLPPLFYLSIFVIVGLWLRPLLKDLNLITAAAQRFAADYREPLTTARDTSQLTELARRLDDMSERLSGLIQSQKELIAALSHEMRTPLARIRFALAVIGNRAGEDHLLKKQLGELNDDVQEIDRLIATMLSYARLDHPDLRMNWQHVPVDAWLAEVREKLHHPGKTLTMTKDDALEAASMDPRLMGLALSNLLSNACRFAASEVQCKVSAHDGAYRIEVHDDGKGIPEAQREFVFKAFTRMDDSRNRETGGYGLGLAIVSRIAELHGGKVGVDESRELGGARFVLRWAAPEP